MTTADLARLDPWLIDDVEPLPDGGAPCGLAAWADRPLAPPARALACQRVEARAAALAIVMTGHEPLAARRQLDATLRDTVLAERAALVQAILQHLDANWMAGLATDLQCRLAMSLLQSALRLSLDVEEQPQTVGCALVSVLPGTPDLCGVMVKVALLRGAGWSVRLLLPQSCERIRVTARELQPDLIVLAGSRLAVRPNELSVLSGLLPALATDGPAPVVIGGKLADTDPQAVLRQGGAAVCGALAWIPTIAATLALPKAANPAGRSHAQAPAPLDDTTTPGLPSATRARRS